MVFIRYVIISLVVFTRRSPLCASQINGHINTLTSQVPSIRRFVDDSTGWVVINYNLFSLLCLFVLPETEKKKNIFFLFWKIKKQFGEKHNVTNKNNNII